MRVIRIGTLPEQMLFDKERIVVQAGKPVEILFENTDLMPHNFVVTQPGVAGRDRPAGRGDGHAARTRRERHYVPAVGQDPARQPAAPAARDRRSSSFTAPDAAGRLSLCLHLSRPLAADVRGAVRRRRPRSYRAAPKPDTPSPTTPILPSQWEKRGKVREKGNAVSHARIMTYMAVAETSNARGIRTARGDIGNNAG